MSVSRTNAVLIGLLALATLAFANPATMLRSNAELRAHDHKNGQLQGTFSSVLANFKEPLGAAECIDGMAAELFACDGVDMLGFVPTAALGQENYADASPNKLEGSDVWGWTSPNTDDEYVLMGKTNSTVFFRIELDQATGKKRLANLGELPNRSTSQSVWKDIKVRDNHAFIVAEAAAHGLQVIDLTQLDGLTEKPTRRFEELSLYKEMAANTHNVVINEDSPHAILVGGSTGDTINDLRCGNGGMRFINIEDPAKPFFEGCSPNDLYVHDANCVTYRGPVAEYRGRELCFSANEEWASIVDVTDKLAPVTIGIFPYPQSSYVHQGWLTEDHAFFLLGDETDEQTFGGNTRTMIFDFRESLTLPQLPVVHLGETAAIDHNMYTKDGLLYQSNYGSGLRILDTEGLYSDTPSLKEVGFFDVFPDNDAATFTGTWSNYPWFEDGVVAVNAYDGIFLLQVDADLLAAEEFDPNA